MRLALAYAAFAIAAVLLLAAFVLWAWAIVVGSGTLAGLGWLAIAASIVIGFVGAGTHPDGPRP